MELLSPFADIEDMLLDVLAPAGPTVLATPALITPPLILVRRIGGSDDRITDVARVRVATFAATHAESYTLAEACRQLIMASPATSVGGVTIDRAVTDGAPAYVDYGQPPLQRYVATYRLELRRRVTT